VLQREVVVLRGPQLLLLLVPLVVYPLLQLQSASQHLVPLLKGSLAFLEGGERGLIPAKQIGLLLALALGELAVALVEEAVVGLRHVEHISHPHEQPSSFRAIQGYLANDLVEDLRVELLADGTQSGVAGLAVLEPFLEEQTQGLGLLARTGLVGDGLDGEPGVGAGPLSEVDEVVEHFW
jgi:hypothetical protein